VPVSGVGGIACVRGMKADFGPSATGVLDRDSEETFLWWPRRKALADGGGSGSTSVGGEGVFFGGEMLRAVLAKGD